MAFYPFATLGGWLHGGWRRLTGSLRRARFWIVFLLAIVVLLVIYYAVANRYTPFSNDAYVQAYVIQVAPRVSGQVIAVHVKENQRVARGDLLFEIDPRPFENKLRQFEASLVKNRQLVAQMESELVAAKGEDAKIAADESYAESVFKQESIIYKKDATTERKYLDAQQKHLGMQALRTKTKATIRQKEDALNAMIGDEHAMVAEVQAQLATARLQCEWTKIYSPVNGLVTDLQLQAGSFVVEGHAVLTCIDTDSWWIVANFRENNLESIREGQPAAIAFKTYPGQVMSAKVATVGWGVAQGQGVPSGLLPGVKNPQEWIPQAQRFQVRLVLDNTSDIPLRVGATCSVTVYTSDDEFLNGIADGWQWLAAWLNYLR